jgi:hypothetical protein
LLYTGVTRGKRIVVLVGQKKAVAIAVHNISGRRRWSKLAEWLSADVSKRYVLHRFKHAPCIRFTPKLPTYRCSAAKRRFGPQRSRGHGRADAQRQCAPRP